MMTFLELCLTHGVSIAFSGETGAGKTSLAGCLLGYAAKLCRDAAIDALRRQTRQKRGGADVFYSELDECLPSGEDVAGALEARELAESISCYLRTLDADTRSMFVRRYFSMDELGELAADFGLTAHAVSARLYRVRQGLKAYLQKEGVVA